MPATRGAPPIDGRKMREWWPTRNVWPKLYFVGPDGPRRKWFVKTPKGRRYIEPDEGTSIAKIMSGYAYSTRHGWRKDTEVPQPEFMNEFVVLKSRHLCQTS